MSWSQMADMKKSPAEKAEEIADMKSYPGIENIADYPYGLTLTLGEDELEKLGLDQDCDVGDMIDVRAFAEVTSISKNKDCCRVELQIVRMAVENETTEEPGK